MVLEPLKVRVHVEGAVQVVFFAMVFDLADVELQVLQKVHKDCLQTKHVDLWLIGAVSLQVQQQVLMLNDVLLNLTLGLVLSVV